jgi:hypothetical protein
MTPDARGWFEESGPMHYAEHIATFHGAAADGP